MSKIPEASLKEELFNQYRSFQVDVQDHQLAMQAGQQSMTGLQQYFQGRDWWNEFIQTAPDDTPNNPAFKTKQAAIVQHATALMQSKPNQWLQTKEIFDHVIAAGIKISGNNPHNTVSAHLSNSGKFVNERTRGWKLK